MTEQTAKMQKKSMAVFGAVPENSLILPALLGVYIWIMVLTSTVTAWQGLRFYLFQIFGMLIPGAALLKRLHVVERESMAFSVFGYGFGFIIVILEYFLLAPFRGIWLLLPLQTVLGIISTLYLLLPRFTGCVPVGREVSHRTAEKEWLPLAVLLTAVLAIRYITYYGFNLLPMPGQDVTFRTQDLLFYIGNAVSAERGFPVAEFRFAGETFYYHYLGSIQLAVASLSTGIDAMTLEFCLNWITPSILVVTFFWCFLRQLEVPVKRTVLGMFLLLFTTGKELVVYVAFQHKMYQSPFGWDVGMAFGILFLALLHMQHQQKTLHRGIWLGTLLAFWVCEGAKAPIAVILLAVAGGVCLVWLLTHKRRSWAFVYGLPLLVVFVTTYLGFVSHGFSTVTTNTTGLKVDFTGHIYECGLGKLYFDWTAQGLPGPLGKLLVIALFFFGCNMAAYYLFAVSGFCFLKKGLRQLFSFEGCLIFGVLLGLLFTLITKQSGNSQMYFAMTSFPLAVAVSVKLLPDSAEWGRYRSRLFYVCLTLLLVWSFGCFVQILSPSVRDGCLKLQGVSDFDGEENNSLTWEELQAYTWVRENTEEDAWFVTNVITHDEQYQSFVVGAATERQMYLEGWRYVIGVMEQETVFLRREQVRAFFAGDREAGRELLEAGVDYVLWTERYGTLTEELEQLFGKEVYRNDAVRVYRLSETQ